MLNHSNRRPSTPTRRTTRRGAALACIVGGLVLIPSQSALALCAAGPLKDGTFEAQRSGIVSSPWVAEGRAGMDVRRGNSHSGRNNAYAINNSGWNAIHQDVWLSAGTKYTLTGYVRWTKYHMAKEGYFGFRWPNGRPASEINFGNKRSLVDLSGPSSSLNPYVRLTVSFRPPYSAKYSVFTGFWARAGMAWIRVDDMYVTYPCDDNPTEPADA